LSLAAFEREQRPLSLEPTGISRQASVGTDDADAMPMEVGQRRRQIVGRVQQQMFDRTG